MKKISGAFLFVALLFALASCGKSAASQWQEQYDLGQKYLLEEDYGAAIVAFTAAIEIDPNEAAAYVGRGDAYMMRAEAETQTVEESYENAAADYETALSLYAEEDNTSEVIEKLSESYLALAEYYEAQGDDDTARTYYEKAYELTGDEEIAERIEMLEQAEEVEEEEGSEELEVPPLDEEPLVDEDAIEYVAKYTADLVYDVRGDDFVAGTANLYVCSEKEAILCVEALKEEEIDEQFVDWDWRWSMYFSDYEFDGSDRGWYTVITWYYQEDGIVSGLKYVNYDEGMSNYVEDANYESTYSSEESVMEKDGKMHIQMRFVISEDDTFEFHVLENYKRMEGYVSFLG